MIAVGIDISKAKSTVAVIDSDGTVLASPFTMAHTQPEMEAFVTYLKGLGEPTTILMEYTGHYHYPVLKKLQDEGFPVCIVNPYQMKKYGDVEIHKAKTDKKDALRIAAYALEKSYKLVPYSSMEQKYEDLKFLSRQYNQRISYVAKLKVQLIALLDQTMPGITRILPLNSRNPEKCALLLFIKRFKSFDEIQRIGKVRFLASYDVLAKKASERSASSKGLSIYELAVDSITTRGEGPYIWLSQIVRPFFCATSRKKFLTNISKICRSVLFHVNTKRDRVQEQPQRFTAVAVACFTTTCLWGGSFYGITVSFRRGPPGAPGPAPAGWRRCPGGSRRALSE